MGSLKSRKILLCHDDGHGLFYGWLQCGQHPGDQTLNIHSTGSSSSSRCGSGSSRLGSDLNSSLLSFPGLLVSALPRLVVNSDDGSGRVDVAVDPGDLVTVPPLLLG